MPSRRSKENYRAIGPKKYAIIASNRARYTLLSLFYCGWVNNINGEIWIAICDVRNKYPTDQQVMHIMVIQTTAN